MVKKILLGILLLLIVGAAIGYQIHRPKLDIVTAYAAKCACTNVFAARRTAAEVEGTDLNYSLLKYASLEVDENQQSVSATLAGLAPKTAVYKRGLGCILLDGKDDYDIHYPLGNSLSVTYPKNIFSTDRLPDVDYAEVTKVLERYTDPKWQTRALLIARKDTLIGEYYSEGITGKTPLLGWSMTKSIANALIGILVQDSLLTLDQDHLLEEWVNDDRAKITLDQLLRMTSGLEWQEVYGEVSDATTMLFRDENIMQALAAKPLQHEPGSHWQYSSGTTNILSGVVRNTINNDKKYWRLLEDRLFDPMMMNSAFVETDESGNLILSSFGYANARDWASFGLLYLNDGVANGIRVLPEGWVDYSASNTLASQGQYGAHFWTNHGRVAYPSAPADLFAAQGYQGQYVIIIPSQDLVIVRIGLDASWPADAFLGDLLAALRQKPY